MPYNALKIFLASIIISYFYAAFYATSHVPEGEVYPFFSWFVFTRVPQKLNTEYAVKIAEYGNRKLDPPVFFADARGIYVKNSVALPTYNYIIQSLGANVEAGQPSKIKQYREALEESFLSLPVVYEIVRIEFDTLELWNTGKFSEVGNVTAFTAAIGDKQ